MTTTEPPQRAPTTPPPPPPHSSSTKPTPDTTSAPSSLYLALTSIHPSDFLHVHKLPCVREALLTGITTGFAFGGVKLILRATIPVAANWAAGMFCGSSLVVYETCQYRRWKERRGVKRAIEIMERSGGKKKAPDGEAGVVGKPRELPEGERSRAKALERVGSEGEKNTGGVSIAESSSSPPSSSSTPAGASSTQPPQQVQSKSWYRFW